MLSQSNYDDASYDDDFYDADSPSSNMSREEETGVEEKIMSHNTYETLWSQLDADPSGFTAKTSTALNSAASNRTYSKFNSSLTLQKSSRVKPKKLKIPFRKKIASKNKEKKKKSSKVIQPNPTSIIERILSANRKRSNELHNTIYEMQKQIDDLTIDNKFLKREGTLNEQDMRNVQITKDMMRMHSEEIRVIKAKYQDEKKNSNNLGKNTKRIESELHKTKDRLKKLEVMASEKNLGERIDLKNVISNLESVVEKKNSDLINLNRSLHLQKKLHCRMMKEKDQLLSKTNDKLKLLEQSKKDLQDKVNEGEKKLAKTNIYSRLAMKAKKHKYKKTKKRHDMNNEIGTNSEKKAYKGNFLEKDVNTMVSKLGFMQEVRAAQNNDMSNVHVENTVKTDHLGYDNLASDCMPEKANQQTDTSFCKEVVKIRPQSGRFSPKSDASIAKEFERIRPSSGNRFSQIEAPKLKSRSVDETINELDESVDDFYDVNNDSKNTNEVERLHQKLDDIKIREKIFDIKKDVKQPLIIDQNSYEEEESTKELPTNKVNSEKELSNEQNNKDLPSKASESKDTKDSGRDTSEQCISVEEKDEPVVRKTKHGRTRHRKSWEFNQTDENMHKGLPAYSTQPIHHSQSTDIEDNNSTDDLGRGYSPTPMKNNQHVVKKRKGRIRDCFSEFENPFAPEV